MADQRRQGTIRTYFLPVRLNDGEGDFYCMFSHSQIVEILGPRPIQRVPCSPGYLKGVIHHQDDLLPVISLDEFWNGEPLKRQIQYRQLVIVRTGTIDPATNQPLKAVVAAPARVQIVKLAMDELEAGFKELSPPPSLHRSGIVRGYYQRKDEYIALCDLTPMVQGALEARMGGQNP